MAMRPPNSDTAIRCPHPIFTDENGLKTFDFAVANPPFSDKAWTTGLNPEHDEYERFKHYGVPPAKNGDYAFLLHFIASLKSSGKGAIILPHGVLFRGNKEADIRRNLIRRRYIKGIIGLPSLTCSTAPGSPRVFSSLTKRVLTLGTGSL